jgi:hypothetical protein
LANLCIFATLGRENERGKRKWEEGEGRKEEEVEESFNMKLHQCRLWKALSEAINIPLDVHQLIYPFLYPVINIIDQVLEINKKLLPHVSQ